MHSTQGLDASGRRGARPLVFALSNPTDKAECSYQQAYEWSDGRVVFASGTKFPALRVTRRSSGPSAAGTLFAGSSAFLGAAPAAAAAGLAEGSNGNVAAASGSQSARDSVGAKSSASGAAVRVLDPAQANNCFIFPGIGLGAVASGARIIDDGMLLAAARAVAGEWGRGARRRGAVLHACRKRSSVSISIEYLSCISTLSCRLRSLQRNLRLYPFQAW